MAIREIQSGEVSSGFLEVPMDDLLSTFTVHISTSKKAKRRTFAAGLATVSPHNSWMTI